MIGLIVGSGFNDFPLEQSRTQVIDTAYGEAEVVIGLLDNTRVALIYRHGADHRYAPHMVPSRAQIAALKELCVKAVIATATVGGLSADNEPGHLTVPDQIIDYTSGRENTFWDAAHPTPIHVDFTEPFDAKVREALLEAGKEAKVYLFNRGTYACTQGPRLETAAEIRRLIMDGCDMVGMTAMPEAGLAREAGLPYALLCGSVNWGAGLADKALDFEQIQLVMQQVAGHMKNVIIPAIHALDQ